MAIIIRFLRPKVETIASEDDNDVYSHNRALRLLQIQQHLDSDTPADSTDEEDE